MERKLKIKKGKGLDKGFEEAGLDYLLGYLSDAKAMMTKGITLEDALGAQDDALGWID